MGTMEEQKKGWKGEDMMGRRLKNVLAMALAGMIAITGMYIPEMKVRAAVADFKYDTVKSPSGYLKVPSGEGTDGELGVTVMGGLGSQNSPNVEPDNIIDNTVDGTGDSRWHNRVGDGYNGTGLGVQAELRVTEIRDGVTDTGIDIYKGINNDRGFVANMVGNNTIEISRKSSAKVWTDETEIAGIGYVPRGDFNSVNGTFKNITIEVKDSGTGEYRTVAKNVELTYGKNFPTEAIVADDRARETEILFDSPQKGIKEVRITVNQSFQNDAANGYISVGEISILRNEKEGSSAPSDYSVTVKAGVGGKVTVSANNVKKTGTDFSTLVTGGREATLEAVPDNGYEFVGWKQADGSDCNGSGASITCNAEGSYVAEFRVAPKNLLLGKIATYSDGALVGWPSGYTEYQRLKMLTDGDVQQTEGHYTPFNQGKKITFDLGKIYDNIQNMKLYLYGKEGDWRTYTGIRVTFQEAQNSDEVDVFNSSLTSQPDGNDIQIPDSYKVQYVNIYAGRNPSQTETQIAEVQLFADDPDYCSVAAQYAGRSDKTMGSITVDSASVLKGESAMFEARTYAGYAFEGWYKDLAATELVSTSAVYSSETITEDVILYAKFIPRKYKVSCKSTEGGTVKYQGNDFTVKEDCGPGEVINLIASPNEGYTLRFWKDTDRNRVLFNQLSYEFVVTGDVSLEPVFVQQDKVTVTFKHSALFSHQFIKSEVVDLNAQVSLPSLTDMDKPGYTFKGWKETGSDDIVEPDATISAQGNTVYVAQYEPSEASNFTVKVTGGTIKGLDETEKTCALDEIVTVVATVEGNQSFEGWYATITGGKGETLVSKNVEYSFPVKSNMELKAVTKEQSQTDENAKPVLTIGISSRESVDEGTQRVRTQILYDTVPGVTILSKGILRATTEENSKNMVLGAGEGVKQYTASGDNQKGSYIMNITVRGDNAQTLTVYTRGYLTYRVENTGEIYTIYTDVCEYAPVS